MIFLNLVKAIRTCWIATRDWFFDSNMVVFTIVVLGSVIVNKIAVLAANAELFFDHDVWFLVFSVLAACDTVLSALLIRALIQDWRSRP